ncbi:hypothetical protein BRADI_2g45241v3, partial [Brachypodium distachyon]
LFPFSLLILTRPTQTSFSSVSSQRSRDPRELPAAAEVLLLPVSSFSSGPFTPRLPPLSPLFLDLRRSPADRGPRRRRPGDWLRRRQSPAARVGKNSKTIGDFHPDLRFPFRTRGKNCWITSKHRAA